jgi:16S rRNA A1518/A1519 N6-dimethyltransferase RsmA/KsgA/DIM1 with predicted DNA glycosylase/AP lyase activity
MPRYLGQHFLKDQKKVSRIVAAIQKMVDVYKKTHPEISLIEV